MISVCFLIAILSTSYSVSTTFIFLQAPASTSAADAVYGLSIPNSEAVIDTVSRLWTITPFSELFGHTFENFSALMIDMFSNNISVFFAVLRAIHFRLNDSPGPALAFPVLGIFFALFYQIFINNILIIGEKRFFLENRNYRQVPISKIFFLYKLRYIRHPSWVMFCRTVFQFLWNFTIIGGIIKHYEYILIPYILAENPKAGRKDAFSLSRQLMHRNKWKFFLLDLSFLGWQILGILSMGILSFFFVNPYITATRSELYASLRRNYVLSRSAGYEILNDSYLEHVPSEDELLISKALYDDSQGPYTRISYFEPEQYPVFLFSVQPPIKAVKSPVKSDRKYDLLSYLFLGIAFSIFGWAVETFLRLTQTGRFWPDHPLLHGPWLPLYGIFGVLLLLLLRRMNKKPVLTFILSTLIYTLLEYFTGFLSEKLFGIRLSNFSNFYLNLDGRVYVGGAVMYALIGCAFLYYLAPKWTDFYMKLGHSRRILLCVILYLLFIADVLFMIFGF